MRQGDFQHRKRQLHQMPYVERGCDDRNEFWALDLIGEPEEGLVKLDFSLVKDGTPFSGEVEIDWDSTPEDAEAAFLTHPGIAEDDVSVSGGNWPYRTLIVEFKGDLAATEIGLPFIDRSELLPLFWTGVNFSRYPGAPH